LGSERIFPINSNVNQSFSNLLPNFIFRKKFSKKSNIRIFYRSSVGFPSINQLQDVVNLANPLIVSTGNASLKQSYTHFLGNRFSFTNTKNNTSFFLGLFLQATQNYIANATFIPRADSIIQQGIKLKKGSQLTKPLNFDGYRNIRTFINYSRPIKFLKSIASVNGGFTYSKIPGLVNSNNIITNNIIYNAGISLTSNINEYVDYSLSYSVTNNRTNSSNSVSRNSTNQLIGGQVNLLHKKGWFVQNDISYVVNTGLSAGFNQRFGLWNAAIGKKFLEKNAGEIKLSVYDLLKQNQSITRTVDENKIQDTQNLVLQQYFMLTFTYSLKNFGKPAKKTSKDDSREEINKLLQQR
jgi:Outer membrane protein beta-barrel family